MVRDVNLISYLPQFMQEYKELKKLFEIEEPELESIFEQMDIIRKNLFIESCDENGIKRFEKLLKITPSKTDSLEVRRDRVKALWIEEIPYTYEALAVQLDNIIGIDGYEMTLHNKIYQLDVKIKLMLKHKYFEVIKFMERVVPCNIVQNIFIDYNKYRDFRHFMHREVGKYTFKQLREQVIDFENYFNENSEYLGFMYKELNMFENGYLRRKNIVSDEHFDKHSKYKNVTNYDMKNVSYNDLRRNGGWYDGVFNEIVKFGPFMYNEIGSYTVKQLHKRIINANEHFNNYNNYENVAYGEIKQQSYNYLRRKGEWYGY